MAAAHGGDKQERTARRFGLQAAAAAAPRRWERKRGGDPGSCAGLFDAQGWKIHSRCPKDLRGSACLQWRLFYL